MKYHDLDESQRSAHFSNMFDFGFLLELNDHETADLLCGEARGGFYLVNTNLNNRVVLHDGEVKTDLTKGQRMVYHPRTNLRISFPGGGDQPAKIIVLYKFGA